MDYARHFAEQAQRWHETDHGRDRGRPLRRSRFVEPVDEVPFDAPESFRDCPFCDPSRGESSRDNPFWARVMAWESSS